MSRTRHQKKAKEDKGRHGPGCLVCGDACYWCEELVCQCASKARERDAKKDFKNELP